MTDIELVKLSRGGDNVALDKLLNRYKPLVNAIARKYFLIGAGTDDLVQEGMIGLYKACINYKIDSFASFKTFAGICITRQIETAVRTSNRNKNLPLNTYFSISNQGKIIVQQRNNDDDDGEEETGIYISSNSLSPEESILFKERISEINELIEKALSGFEKSVLKQYMTGRNYIEIAQNLKRDPKSIDNALNRIKIKLKFLRN